MLHAILGFATACAPVVAKLVYLQIRGVQGWPNLARCLRPTSAGIQ